MIHVDVSTLKTLRDLRSARDRDAGRLGAAVLEMIELAAQIRQSIDNSVRAETQLATRALQELGVDVDNGNYRIDKMGTVQRLTNGAWQTME